MASNPFDLLPKEQAEVSSSPRGTSYLWRPARGMLVTRVEGVLTLEGGLAIERLMRRVVLENGKLTPFFDWEPMTDYETETRTRLMQVSAELRTALDGAHVLVASRIVALGVQTANLVLKSLTVYTARAPFESALREALQRRRPAS